jgi:ribonuclease P/MRP protein subunit RPP1
MAADNRVAIDLDLSVLISGRGNTRQRAMHRFRDVLTLEQRFEFPLTLSSYAHSVLDMRAVREITGLCSLIGMDISDVENAFSGVDLIISSPPRAVTVIP